MIIRKLNILFLLTLLLFLNFNIALYDHIVLGKENDDKDFNDNRDSSREDDIIEKDEEEEDIPFILPFNAVPFP